MVLKRETRLLVRKHVGTKFFASPASLCSARLAREL